MMLTDLADVSRNAGLTTVEIPGWKTRGRPASSGGFDPRGVLAHHTGGASGGRSYAEWLATTGRPDLPAPLCQLALDRDGTVYVCAAGRANHAGAAKASGPMPAGDGNTLYIGIEAMNTGSEGWSAAQYDAYVRLCAALCKAYGYTAAHVRGHKETSVTGKWDPGRIDMDAFRKAVVEVLAAKPPKPPKPPKPATRGKNVDAALALLRKAKGTGDRRKRLDAAIAAVERIETI